MMPNMMSASPDAPKMEFRGLFAAMGLIDEFCAPTNRGTMGFQLTRCLR